jgi:ribonuclease Z
MRPSLHPTLVNGRTGDPALYVETLFERRAILFDLGDIAALSPRKVHRLEHVFVSHTHIDHFIGFDRLLRLLVGREKTVRLYGPEGFIGQVEHKLAGYRWNLVERYAVDLIFEVMEIWAGGETCHARFRFKRAFAREELGAGRLVDNVVYREPTFHVSTAVLEHRGLCLGFAIAEAAHVNVWKNKLVEQDLKVGPWLRALKQAVVENRPDDFAVPVTDDKQLPLGALRALVTVTPGQKIAYVTDVADTPENRERVTTLARDADILFIEAAFAQADTKLAAERAHLTTAAAGRIARAANVRRVEPFHFSPRYSGQDAQMITEVMAAFTGGGASDA